MVCVMYMLYIWYGTPLALAPRMTKDQAPKETPGEKDEITPADIQALLADLNIDSLIASLDASPEPSSAAPAPAATPTTPAGYGEERRAAPRLAPRELSGDIRLTIPGVSDILMVNISETGALIETSRRLSPGTAADLFVRLNGKRHTVRAKTVRSTLRAINSEGAAIYRTALEFEKRLPLEAA